MEQIGAVCGRFQIFHKEHLQYVLAAKARCRRLIVGITSPDPTTAPAEAADENRGRVEANPCSYYERMKMVEGALLEAGLERASFDIVPFPIGRPELMGYYIPQGTPLYVTILDAWGHCKTDRLRQYGYPVEVLWDDKPKGVSSTMVRRRICQGEDWSDLVPPATYRFVQEHSIDTRIREMCGE